MKQWAIKGRYCTKIERDLDKVLESALSHGLVLGSFNPNEE